MYTKEDNKLRISRILGKIGLLFAFIIMGSGMASGMIEEDIKNIKSIDTNVDPKAYSNNQLVLLDVTYEHNTVTKAFSFFNFPSGMPTNLISPINYAKGRLYQRVQVITKPSTKTVKYQFCVFQDKIVKEKHACTNEGLLSFTSPGTYYANQDMTSLFQYGNLDWSRSLLKQMLVVKDINGKPVDDRYGWAGTWSGSPNFALYYPMKVRYTAIIVPPGGGSPIWPDGSQPSNGITVTSPNGGENIVKGTYKTISWGVSGNTGSNVKIELLKGGLPNSYISSSAVNSGSYNWLVPSTATLGTDYKIRITSTSNPLYTDTSNGNFQISNGASGTNSLTVVSPNGGEDWIRGSKRTIKWSSTGIPSTENVDIKVYQGAIQRAHWITPNDGIFYLTVTPTTYPIGTNYKVKITGVEGYYTISDTSNNYFKVS